MRARADKPSMGRRPSTWDENDAFGPWRHVLYYVARPGVRAKIKAQHNRRDRRKTRADLRKETTP